MDVSVELAWRGRVSGRAMVFLCILAWPVLGVLGAYTAPKNGAAFGHGTLAGALRVLRCNKDYVLDGVEGHYGACVAPRTDIYPGRCTCTCMYVCVVLSCFSEEAMAWFCRSRPHANACV